MQPTRAMLIFALIVLNALSAAADPENFIVGPLTFVRPPTWKWEPLPDHSSVSAQLLIAGTADKPDSQVLISSSPTPLDDIAARWKSYFVEPPKMVYKVNHATRTNVPVTYITVEGTYRKRGKLNPGYFLLGAYVKTKNGNVFGRLIGPKNMVQSSTADFKKMIETALIENE